jgi:hypothetical protein
MTEAEWQTCDDPDLMLEAVVGTVLRQQLATFVRLCWARPPVVSGAGWALCQAADEFACAIPGLGAMDAARYASEAALKASVWAQSSRVERRCQAELLRHLIGNPFRPYRLPPFWPEVVIDLARQMSQGDDVSVVLADALEDAGHGQLAEHFRRGPPHAQACWALHLILNQAVPAQ